MIKVRFLLLLFCYGFFLNAQELQCHVTINSDKVAQTNKKVFASLKTGISDFMNNTKFTSKTYGRNQKIACSLVVFIENVEANKFKASLQIQSSRPVYNSDYNAPIFNFKDDKFSFQYIEFEPLNYNENNYESELVALLSFYAHLIIGLDADTFEKFAGDQSLDKARTILNLAQQTGGSGWKQSDGNNSRYFIINDILNNTYSAFREALYLYHLKGLDLMAGHALNGKKAVADALYKLSEVHQIRPNALVTRLFFDAKTDEIVSVFSSGPEFSDKQQLIDLLTRINPLGGAKWNRM